MGDASTRSRGSSNQQRRMMDASEATRSLGSSSVDRRHPSSSIRMKRDASETGRSQSSSVRSSGAGGDVILRDDPSFRSRGSHNSRTRDASQARSRSSSRDVDGRTTPRRRKIMDNQSQRSSSKHSARGASMGARSRSGRKHRSSLTMQDKSGHSSGEHRSFTDDASSSAAREQHPNDVDMRDYYEDAAAPNGKERPPAQIEFDTTESENSSDDESVEFLIETESEAESIHSEDLEDQQNEQEKTEQETEVEFLIETESEGSAGFSADDNDASKSTGKTHRSHLPDFDDGEFSFADLEFGSNHKNQGTVTLTMPSAQKLGSIEAPSRSEYLLDPPQQKEEYWICADCHQEHESLNMQFCSECGAARVVSQPDKPRIAVKKGDSAERTPKSKHGRRSKSREASRQDHGSTSRDRSGYENRSKSQVPSERDHQSTSRERSRHDSERSRRGVARTTSGGSKSRSRSGDSIGGSSRSRNSSKRGGSDAAGGQSTPKTPSRSKRKTVQRSKSDLDPRVAVVAHERWQRTPESRRKEAIKRSKSFAANGRDGFDEETTTPTSSLKKASIRKAIPRRTKSGTADYIQHLRQQEEEAVPNDSDDDASVVSTTSSVLEAGKAAFKKILSLGGGSSHKSNHDPKAQTGEQPTLAANLDVQSAHGNTPNLKSAGPKASIVKQIWKKWASAKDNDEGDQSESESDREDSFGCDETPPARSRRRRRGSISGRIESGCSAGDGTFPTGQKEQPESTFQRECRDSIKATGEGSSLDDLGYSGTNHSSRPGRGRETWSTSQGAQTPRRRRMSLGAKEIPNTPGHKDLGYSDLDPPSRRGRRGSVGNGQPSTECSEPPCTSKRMTGRRGSVQNLAMSKSEHDNTIPAQSNRGRARRMSLGATQMPGVATAVPTKSGDRSANGEGRQLGKSSHNRRRRASLGGQVASSHDVLQQRISHMPQDPTHLVRKELQEAWDKAEEEEEKKKASKKEKMTAAALRDRYQKETAVQQGEGPDTDDASFAEEQYDKDDTGEEAELVCDNPLLEDDDDLSEISDPLDRVASSQQH